MQKHKEPRTKGEQIEFDIAQVEATMKMEDLILTEQEKQELLDIGNDKISVDEAVDKAIARHYIKDNRLCTQWKMFHI